MNFQTIDVMSSRLRSWGPENVDDQTTFRLWAPDEPAVRLRLEDDYEMLQTNDGWFELAVDRQASGISYGFVLNNGTVVPDPASRQQVYDVSGLSILTDAQAYQWQTHGWRGRPWHEAVIYEIHIGTFTPEGTLNAASSKLQRLASLGVTAIEILPVAQFPGDRGWGYDGVLQFAPHSAYGSPDDFKAFIDAAHAFGIMVFLDVVYNHFGPEGNFLSDYASDFFREDESNAWGREIAFERRPVRDYFLENALYWLDEFRLDGLRFDAVNAIKDPSKPHILEELSKTVAERLKHRHVHLIVENPPNGTDLLASNLFAADWNDSFHHVVHVIAAGEDTGVFAEFSENSFDKLRTILAEGYLDAGEAIVGDSLPPSASLPPTAFVHFLQNHDQVGNRAAGDRLHTTVDPKLYTALTSILLLSPQIPLLFMGDCYKETNRFHYFADYSGEVADKIRRDRPKQAEQFGGYPPGFSADDIPDPHAISTFLDSKLEWRGAEMKVGKEWSDTIRRLLAVRQREIIPWLKSAGPFSGTIVESPFKCLYVDWKLGEGTLQLRANLSDKEAPLAGLIGNRIWPDGPNANLCEIPPLSVHVFKTPF